MSEVDLSPYNRASYYLSPLAVREIAELRHIGEDGEVLDVSAATLHLGIDPHKRVDPFSGRLIHDPETERIGADRLRTETDITIGYLGRTTLFDSETDMFAIQVEGSDRIIPAKINVPRADLTQDLEKPGNHYSSRTTGQLIKGRWVSQNYALELGPFSQPSVFYRLPGNLGQPLLEGLHTNRIENRDVVAGLVGLRSSVMQALGGENSDDLQVLNRLPRDAADQIRFLLRATEELGHILVESHLGDEGWV